MNKKVLSLGVMLSLVTTGAFAADVVTTSVNNGDQLSKYQRSYSINTIAISRKICFRQ